METDDANAITADEMLEMLNADYQMQIEANTLLTPEHYKQNGKECIEYKESSLISVLRDGDIHLLDRNTLNMIADALTGRIKKKRGNKEKDNYAFVHFELHPKYRELERVGVIGKEREEILFKMLLDQGMGASRKNLERLIQEELEREKLKQEYNTPQHIP